MFAFIINIHTADLKERKDYVTFALLLSNKDSLKLINEKNKEKELTAEELTHFHGEQAKRGMKLPKTHQQLIGIEKF